MIDVVLFDLDATLVDDGPNWSRSVDQTVQMVCIQHPRTDSVVLREKYYDVAGSVWEEIRGVEAAPWGNMDDEEIVRRVWDSTLVQVGVENVGTVEKVVKEYLGLRSSGAHAFDDAEACLSELSSSYKLGIVTNGTSAQQVPKLNSSGLARFFQVVTTTDVGFGKPQTEIFMHALSTLTAKPEEAVYVGDSLSWDVDGANKAGISSVWLNRQSVTRKFGSPVPDKEIASLTELSLALAELSSD